MPGIRDKRQSKVTSYTVAKQVISFLYLALISTFFFRKRTMAQRLAISLPTLLLLPNQPFLFQQNFFPLNNFAAASAALLD
jgi:hypothetical protein